MSTNQNTPQQENQPMQPQQAMQYPQKPKKKKWPIVLAVIVIVIVIAVIGNALGSRNSDDSANSDSNSVSDSSDNKQESAQTTQEDKESVYGLNIPAENDEVQITVTKVERSNGKEYDKPDDGKEFVIVTVKIKNIGDEKLSYNSYDFKMSNSQGQVTDESFTTVDSDTALSYGELKSGGEVEGTISFEQPKGDEGLILEYYDNSFDDDPTFEFSLK